jgi:hypothetical protein
LAEVGRFRRRGQPFDFTHNAPSPGRYPPDDLTIPGVIAAIRHAEVEVGYGFDVSERQVFRQVGNHEEIRGFAQRDLLAIADGRSCIIIRRIWNFRRAIRDGGPAHSRRVISSSCTSIALQR